MDRLAHRIAVVAGGARGIGMASVKRMMAEGATVVIGDVLDPVEDTGARFERVDATEVD